MTTAMQTERVGERELVITQHFDAPVELVWKAWTDPVAIAAWFGPHGFTTTVTTLDLRPGGVWHYCMHNEEYGDAWGKAVYVEVDPPRRLVYQDMFSDAEGNTNEEMPVTTVTITLAEQDGGTLFTSHALYAAGEDLAKVLEMGMEQGMAETLERLGAYVTANA
jgi:uncharacterized protein YndB with AHSA1/START domain